MRRLSFIGIAFFFALVSQGVMSDEITAENLPEYPFPAKLSAEGFFEGEELSWYDLNRDPGDDNKGTFYFRRPFKKSPGLFKAMKHVKNGGGVLAMTLDWSEPKTGKTHTWKLSGFISSWGLGSFEGHEETLTLSARIVARTRGAAPSRGK